jgi:hypothetical protein
MSTLILSAYRIKKNVDIFNYFLEPSVKLTYNLFKKHEFIEILHQIIIMEASENISKAKEEGFEIKEKYKGVLAGDSVHTYHEIKNKFDKASHKKTSGDPFDQNIKVMIKWDSEYYYLKFLVNGKISTEIVETIERNFDFLEEYSFSTGTNSDRGEVWETLMGSELSFINFLQFDILSPERIIQWIMEPIFKLPEGEDWTYKFPIERSDFVDKLDI